MNNVKNFYEALAKDKEMQERWKALTDTIPESEEAALAEIVSFAAKEGYELTTEELKAFTQETIKDGALSDDELEAVTGGTLEEDILHLITHITLLVTERLIHEGEHY